MLIPEDNKHRDTQSGDRPLPPPPPSVPVPSDSAEPPPAYTDSDFQPNTPRAVPSPSTSTSTTETHGRLRPTNYVCISQKHAALKGQYTVDPGLVIPPALLPAPSEGESGHQRKNFKATTTHAPMNVHLRLQSIGSSASPTARAADDKRRLALADAPNGYDDEPITIELCNSHASITARITDALPSPRRKLQIVASTAHAKITLYLPRSFTGPITAGTGGYFSIAFSEALQPHITMFSERDYFVGDLSAYPSALSEGGSSGANGGRLMDTAELRTTHSKILVKWEEEHEEDQASSGVNGFLRFFGF